MTGSKTWGSKLNYLLERIAASKICVRLSTRVEGIQEGKILLRKDERGELSKAETIVLALGSQANNGLLKQLTGKFPQVIGIGDCVQPRNLALGKMKCARRCDQLKEKEGAVMNVNILPKEDAPVNP